MTDFLADYLPIRKILADGVETPFTRDVDFIGAQATPNTTTGAMEFRFGLRVTTSSSGDTLRADYLHILGDAEDATPGFILPEPSTWTGRRILVKRLDQAAASVTFTVSGGANIDGAAEYELIGTNAAAEFWSDGADVYVGPSTTYEPVPEAEYSPNDDDDIYFWTTFDPSKLTLTGTRPDEIRNEKDNGLVLTRSAGTPIIDAASVLNGYSAFACDSTTELMCPSGGPTANEAHWILTVTNGSDSAFSGFARVGAKSGGGGLGVTTTSRYAAGSPAGVGQPRVDSPEPTANGAIRIVSMQHLPTFGHLTSGIDGHAPQAASGAGWYNSQTNTHAGSFGFGAVETAQPANTSRHWATFFGRGVLTAAKRARLCDWLCRRLSITRLAPRLLVLGDSNSDPTPSSPATETWPTRMLTPLNAQLTIDGRTNLVLSNTALSGKFVGGVWSGGGTGNPAVVYQVDGAYGAWRGDANPQAIQYSAEFSRSGRREYEIAILTALTNDYINGNITGAEAVDRLKYVCSKLRSQGFYVILGTTIPGSDNAGYYGNGGPGTREVHRDFGNAWILSNAVADGYAHDVADYEAAGLAWNTTCYGAGPDVVHLNDTGQQLVADVNRAAVYRVITTIINSPLGDLA